MILVDELFKGTNLEDALAISTATLEGLTRFSSSCFVISTHLHQLQETVPVKCSQVQSICLDCEIQNGTPVFNYRMREGWSSMRVGQLLFAKEGLYQLLNRRDTLLNE